MSLLIAFPGQGTQHDKMFAQLSADSFGKGWLKETSAAMNLDLFDELIVSHACADVIQVQCLITSLSVGTFYSLKNKINLEFDFLCGYSLGEVSAFCVSVDLSAKEVCELVKNRAFMMQKAADEYSNNQPNGLILLKGRVNAEQVKQLTENHACYVAIINADDHYIIGGLLTDLSALIEEAKTMGVLKARKLAVDLPSHTPFLSEATKTFAAYLQPFQSSVMKYPILNALTQELIVDAQSMITILAQELSQPLQWGKTMHIAQQEYGISNFLELGPREGLKNMALASLPQIKACSSASFSTLEDLAEVVKAF
ncbi:putative malonyl-CoA acyl-carrier-protein transacylase [Legionella nautarum]|uniref:Putative malonyl-CoA acyl-carrier-protein transacylase n=1 Tax=Legionella nautarum TaxID=45070 RepID=A0A0W0WMX8_9GAMM|nr:acyltransferase domain-containing protein [Legionella nautarum]KTD33691.1 putative malonyl-CoA acyl-carrier-protein transacylase [Legionella nautarum]